MERRIACKLAAASLTLGLIALPVSAATDSWSVTGSPSGGGVYKVIVNPTTPSTLYATSGPGVFESTDSGATWALIFPTLDAPTDLALDPQNPDILYTASDVDASKTLFKSTDGGATWAETDTGIGKVMNGTSIDWVSRIAVDPINEGVVYAAGGNTGMYKSTDGGLNWSKIDTGITGLTSNSSFITQLFVDPTDPDVVYLVDTVYGASDVSLAGLYQSVDGGANWLPSGLAGQNIGYVALDPADHTHLVTCFGFLETSTDSGATWSNGTACPFTPAVIVFDPTNSQHLLIGTFSGAYQSVDGGTSYAAITNLDNIGAASFVVDPTTPANVYAATGWGMFTSTDSGATWTLSTTGIHNVVVDLMVEGADDILYLASEGSGIYKSADQGLSWAQVGSAAGVTGSLPMAGDSVYSLVEDPTANSTLYAGTQGGVFKSIDGGDNWTTGSAGVPSSGQTLALAIDPEAPATLYAATNTLGAGVYKSVDGGVTWAAAGNGLTFDPSEGGLQALSVDPHNSSVVYAGSFFTGLFKSTDGGASWQPDNGAIGVTDIWSIAVDPNDSNIVYTCTSNGFFKSTDAGATWTESDYGLGGNFDMTSIQFDPSDSSIIYVTQRYGIGDAFVSPDAGYTWYDMSTLSPIGVDSSAVRSVHRQILPGRVSRGFAGGPGGQVRSTGVLSIRAAAIGPHSTQMLGGGSDGRVYSFDVKDLPKGGHPAAGGGGNGGGSGSGSGAAGGSGSGGGGNFGLLLILGLAGFAARRRI